MEAKISVQALVALAEALDLVVIQDQSEDQLVIYTSIRYDDNGNLVEA